MKESKVAVKSLKRRIEIFHYYYKRSGLYNFLYKSLIKLLYVLGGITILLLGLKFGFKDFDINLFLQDMVGTLPTTMVFSVFLVSESLFGLVPPDIFILWAKGFKSPYLIVGLLAALSYIGGIISFFLGRATRKIDKVNKYIEKKFQKNFDLVKKWGGAVIVLAALFPLPYSTISIMAGAVKYPFVNFLLFGLTRTLRFYIYAVPLFTVVG